MSFLPASRTRRNLLKVASLGLAGLLAGLLAGCNDSTDTTVSAPYTHLSSDSFASDAYSPRPSRLPSSIEATQIPALRHPPTSHRLQNGSIRGVSMSRIPTGRNRS